MSVLEDRLCVNCGVYSFVVEPESSRFECLECFVYALPQDKARVAIDRRRDRGEENASDAARRWAHDGKAFDDFRSVCHICTQPMELDGKWMCCMTCGVQYSLDTLRYCFDQALVAATAEMW